MAQKVKKKTKRVKVEKNPRIGILGTENGLYYHVDSGRVAIRPLALIKYFRDFKRATEKAPRLESFLLLISVWLPLFTSDFRSIFGFSPDNTKGAYFGIILVITILLIVGWIPFILRLIVGAFKDPFKQRFPQLEIQEWLNKTETDPDKKVNEIKLKCRE